MDFSELTAEMIKVRIRKEVPSRKTGLLDRMRQDRIIELTARLKESEEDRAARFDQITELTGLLIESEADRAARFDQITELTRLLKESEADRAAKLEEIRALKEQKMQALIGRATTNMIIYLARALKKVLKR